ncbi:MAG TPA: hypothetical protein VK462_01640, partial [Nitrososphaeraceae archaeon]|nr:hypothetical protein [Nitrososphaeraceae archaeon]
DPKIEQAFAKRFAAEKAKLEQEYADKYKDFDTYKEVSEYFREVNEAEDVLSLKERIEMERLQARAEKAEIPVEVQKRLEQLEEKAAKGEELEKHQANQQFYNKFRSDLDKFIEGKDVKADDIEKYMIDNKVPNMEIAYRAMKFDDAQANKEAIKKEAIQEYLNSKKAPKVEGSGTAGFVQQDPPKTLAEANKRAADRIRAANQNQ